MESSSYTFSSSSSLSQYPLKVQRSKPSASFVTSLHEVRKRPAKLMKKPIASPPPTPPKIYKVEPKNFREVVQKLTGAPGYQLKRLQKLGPPPLNLSPIIPKGDVVAKQQPTNLNALMIQKIKKNSRKESDTFEAFSPLEFTFSPSSQAWLSSFPLSPGTLSSVEANTVL